MRIIIFDLASITRKFFELEKDQRLTDGTALSASIQYITRAADGFDRVAIARDLRPSFRKAFCQTYKAGREAPGAVYDKLELDVMARLYADGASIFPSTSEAKDPRLELTPGGWPEADDVIASLIRWASSLEDITETVVASEDSDLAALVDDDAGVSMRRFDGSLWHEADVIERFGCKPSLIPHVKALGGDDADGYKPFPHPDAKPDDEKTKPGIGPKKAIKLLADFGQYGDPAAEMSLGTRVLWAAQDGVKVDSADKVVGMLDCHERRCLLAGGVAALAMGYNCATMRNDLPLDFSRILAEPVKRSIVPAKRVEPEKAAEVLAKPAEPAPMVLRQTSEVSRPRRDRQTIERYALQPRRFDELCATSEMLFDARMFPQFSTWQGIAGAALVAAEQGIGMGQALRGTYVVEGKLSFSAALIASLVRRAPSCMVLRLVPDECDDKRATVEFQRDDMAKSARYVFTLAMAERMKGGKLSGRDPSRKTKWETQPHLMLCWAALREVCRLYWFDIAAGMYTPDELRAGQDLEDGEFEQTAEDLS